MNHLVINIQLVPYLRILGSYESSSIPKFHAVYILHEMSFLKCALFICLQNFKEF